MVALDADFDHCGLPAFLALLPKNSGRADAMLRFLTSSDDACMYAASRLCASELDFRIMPHRVLTRWLSPVFLLRFIDRTRIPGAPQGRARVAAPSIVGGRWTVPTVQYTH